MAESAFRHTVYSAVDRIVHVAGGDVTRQSGDVESRNFLLNGAGNFCEGTGNLDYTPRGEQRLGLLD